MRERVGGSVTVAQQNRDSQEGRRTGVTDAASGVRPWQVLG